MRERVLQNFEPMLDPGCALFARKFDAAAADAMHKLAREYLSRRASLAGDQTLQTQASSLRHLLESLPADVMSEGAFGDVIEVLSLQAEHMG